MYELIFLFLAGLLSGGVNAIAGGGSFISFPALLFSGLPQLLRTLPIPFPPAVDT